MFCVFKKNKKITIWKTNRKVKRLATPVFLEDVVHLIGPPILSVDFWWTTTTEDVCFQKSKITFKSFEKKIHGN